MSSEFLTIARVNEIEPGGCKVIQLKNRFVAVFNVDGNFYAVDHECPHQGGPLGAGEVDGCVVICPLHGWVFDLASGRCPTSPGISVETFPVRLVGDEVQIEIDLSKVKTLWEW